MMAKWTVRALLVIILAGIGPRTSAAAQPNWLGIYFDEGGTSSCLNDSPFVPFHAYVIYSEPPVAEIFGYEFGVMFHNPMPVLAASAPGFGAISDLAQVSIASPSPIPCGALTTLLDMELLSFGMWNHLYLVEATSPRAPGIGPVVVLADQSLLPVPHESLAASIDGGMELCTGLPVERTTWGTIKGLYR